MKASCERSTVHWSLPDLVDLEALLARTDSVDEAGRRHFVHTIRPQLNDIQDESARRRSGLRQWLEYTRDTDSMAPGQLFGHGLNLAGWTAFAILAFSGMGLVAGLLLGPNQAVHVVVFLGLTLVLPWLIYLTALLLRAAGSRHADGTLIWTRVALGLVVRDPQRQARVSTLVASLFDTRAPRRVLTAMLGGLMQRGAIGFNLGLIVAFVGCLMLFDVRFYWEATPRIGMENLLPIATQVVAWPWGWLWPQAVPDVADIAASRAVTGAVPAVGDGSWWRFLLLSLLVWGLLPRLLLLVFYQLTARRALAQLTFQAPRHRALWRQLNTIERGEVASGTTDGVLVLDVGGHGVTGESIRGYLLRRLRVNPLSTSPVAVLDADREARTEERLAAGPAGVVLLAEGWTLSPRQVQRLHARLRGLLGERVPMTWLVFALDGGRPTAPASGDMQRWTQQIDALRDPATEVAAYDG